MAAIVPYPVAVGFPLTLGGRVTVLPDADRETVGRAAAGDQAAFEALVRGHQREVYALSLRLLGDREDALEAAQDAFLRAFRALPRFRHEATFRTWLLGIVINVCRSRLVSAQHRRERLTGRLERVDPASGEVQPLPIRDPAPDPESLARAGELRDVLLQALRQLSPDHREVLLLREMSGLEYDHLATVLGCAPGTVKSRVARARTALRQALEGVWP